jgi:hypothetical protein
MKAYLAATGTLFGLLAVMHLGRAVVEWHYLATDPWYVLGMAGVGLVVGGLAVWAWRLV